MAGIGGILGNPLLEQILLYNVLGQLIGAGLGPFATALSNTVNTAEPLVALPPADAAQAVIRNLMDHGAAADEAVKAGIDRPRFDVLVGLAGDAPDPTSLAVALRRKLIDQGRYMTGIRQGRLRDEWAALVQELAVVQPSPGAMLAAYLEGQIPEAEARDRYAQLGGDPAYFDILFATEGQAPSPVEALELANRGVIPWTGRGEAAVSYEQAFLEGPWRNKWLSSFRALGEYLPPPRTVTAMHREGALSDAQAIDLYRKAGLSPELARAYMSASASQRTVKTHELAQSTVEALYRDRLIPRTEAAAFLGSLRYTPQEAEYILELVDVQVSQKYLTAAVGRVHTLYVGHKIARAQALAVLGQLQLDATNAGDLVSIWDYERAANVKTLTASEVAAALKLKLVDQPTAQAELEALGYLPHDAWLYLSVHMKVALPGEPPAGSVGSGPGV